MRHRLILYLSFPVLASCTTINLTQPGADDLYWSKKDAVNEPQIQSAPPIESYTDDYWEEGSQTTATTESGDVIVNNYNGGYGPANNNFNSSGWAGWDPYWGWGFGVGWYGPHYYSSWYNWNFCYGNNWYSPYWYHNPWAFGGWGYPGNCSPWNYPFGYYGNGFYGGPVIWGSGNVGDGNSSGGYYYGPFTPVSTNSGSNSSYNPQGQHLGRISATGNETPDNGTGKKPIGPVNYVERIIKPESSADNTTATQDIPVRTFMNIPSSNSHSKPNLSSKPSFKPSQQEKAGPNKVELPPVKPSSSSKKPKFESPSPPPVAAPSPSRSSSPASSGGSPGRSSGGGGNNGGGRPPRQ